jgi:regulator of protease activity HflC (stomatin/prohibitin superfamily)
MEPALIALLVIAVLVIVVVVRTLRIIPQARAAVVERLGRYQRTLEPGIHVLVPFADRIRAMIDLREQVVSFPPQPVITSDNLTVNIDTVIYFQVTEPRAATYAINNYIQAVEQLTVTTLRNVVGSMNLEETLTSRDSINSRLRGELDEATGKWGIRVARVELKAIDPPPSIQDAMEKQMRADRDKRAIILQAEGQRESSIKTAEGQKAAQILSAEGQKQAAILAAEAERQSRILRAEGERAARYLAAQGQAKAIETVFSSIHAADPDPKLLAYQYLQTLPQIAQGDSNKVWIIPSEFSKALEGLSQLTGGEGEASGNWLTEAAKAPASPDRPKELIDTSDWFDSKLPPAREQPEAQIRASDEDEETLRAHQGMSWDPVPSGHATTAHQDAEGIGEDEPDGPRALPSTPPAYQPPAERAPEPARGRGTPADPPPAR